MKSASIDTVECSRTKHSVLKSFLLGLIPVVCICVLPSLYLYAQNAVESPFLDAAGVMLLTTGIGMLVYLVFCLLFSGWCISASLAATLCMAVFSYYYLVYDLSMRILHSETTIPALLVCGGVALVGLVALLILKKRAVLKPIHFLLSVLLCTLVIINAAIAAPHEIKRLQQRASIGDDAAVSASSTLPNFYYIILDEYSPREIMDQYFDTDLSPLYEKLQQQGFAISSTSYNTTSNSLINITDNLYLMDGAVNGMSEKEIHEASGKAPIYAVLHNLGYKTNAVSSELVFAVPMRKGFSIAAAGSVTEAGQTMGVLLYSRTMLFPITQKFGRQLAKQTTASLALQYLADSTNLPTERGQALLCYALSPHVPYSHNADGTLRDKELWYLPHDIEGYLGQHAYTTDMMQQIVQSILSVSPDSVIVIQSDHSYRYAYDDTAYSGIVVPAREMCRIFNAVYYRGEPVDIEGLSGPQTLRLVLTKLGAVIPEEVPPVGAAPNPE